MSSIWKFVKKLKASTPLSIHFSSHWVGMGFLNIQILKLYPCTNITGTNSQVNKVAARVTINKLRSMTGKKSLISMASWNKLFKILNISNCWTELNKNKSVKKKISDIFTIKNLTQLPSTKPDKTLETPCLKTTVTITWNWPRKKCSVL